MKFDLGHINKVVAVNVVLTGENPVYHFLILRYKKGEISFVKRGENITDFDQLIKEVSNKYPVLLHFSGKGILNRGAKNQENYRHTILLNANMDGFYFSDYSEESKVFSSVIRKDTVDEVVQLFDTKKMHVIRISSGPFHSAILQKVIQKNTFLVNGYSLEFNGEELDDFKKSDSDIKQNSDSVLIGAERLKGTLIPCAAIGAAFFNPDEKLIFPENEQVFEINYEEAKQKNIFARFGMGMMLFFLCALFANYLYLGHLNEVSMENLVYLDAYNEQLTEIADLEDEKERKEKLLQSSGLLNRNFLSYYLMELSNSVPDQITFDGIVLRPLKEEIKERKKIAFDEHLLLVTGRSQTSHILSRWIENLEEEEWLDKVDILDYTYIRNEGYFELEMVVF